MRLPACVANFVADEDVVGVPPTADLYQPKRCRGLAHEERDAFAQDDVANHQMDLINQIVRQEIVPERPTPGNQDVFACLAFEFGNLLVRVRTPDDADTGPVSGQRIGDDDGGQAAPAWLSSRCSSVHCGEVGSLATSGQKLLNNSKDTRPTSVVSAVRSRSARIQVEDAAHHGEHHGDIVVWPGVIPIQ